MIRASVWRVSLLLALLPAGCAHSNRQPLSAAHFRAFTYDHDGITRGDRSRRELALVFTADAYGEGTGHVLDVLARRGVKASFFLTGNYLRDAHYRGFVPRMVREGHYVGPHSDGHLLYAPWDDRERSLVRREEFERDLRRNLMALRGLGVGVSGAQGLTDGGAHGLTDAGEGHGLEAHATHHGQDGRATAAAHATQHGQHRRANGGASSIYFIPPYEWYNREHVAWARAMGVQIVNFTPGIGSNRDYMSESDPKFRSSRQILADIVVFEARDPDGLSGAILLLHLGADRRDKMYLLLDALLDALDARGYVPRRIDTLLQSFPDVR